MKKVLYVEDDTLIARLYGQKLAEAGYEVYVVEDGLAAIRWMAQYTPDLVILDLLMPKMTGADVLKFMRQRPELRSVRVIVFSNSFLSSLTKQVAEANVETALIKSAVTPAQLVNVVNDVVVRPPKTLTEATEEGPDPETKREEPGKMDPPTPAVAVEPQPATAPKETEPEFQVRARREFFERTPAILKSVRDLCAGFLDATDAETERKRLQDLTRKIGFLTQMTGMAGCHRVAQLASALEALLFELNDKPALISDSVRQTVVSAVAFLSERLNSTDQPKEQELPPASVLVVDDDAVSNRAVVMALRRARLEATSVADPFVALKQVENVPYDLMLFDIDMPGMDGITLCEKVRALPLHRRTPVVYVTGLTDFKTRTRSLLSGGNDFIAKPILPMELTVKAITQLLKHQPAPPPATKTG